MSCELPSLLVTFMERTQPIANDPCVESLFRLLNGTCTLEQIRTEWNVTSTVELSHAMQKHIQTMCNIVPQHDKVLLLEIKDHLLAIFAYALYIQFKDV